MYNCPSCDSESIELLHRFNTSIGLDMGNVSYEPITIGRERYFNISCEELNSNFINTIVDYEPYGHDIFIKGNKICSEEDLKKLQNNINLIGNSLQNLENCIKSFELDILFCKDEDLQLWKDETKKHVEKMKDIINKTKDRWENI